MTGDNLRNSANTLEIEVDKSRQFKNELMELLKNTIIDKYKNICYNNIKKETNTYSNFYIESILKGGQDYETVF